MKEVWPSMILAFPVAIYVGAVVLQAVPSSEGVFAGMFAVMLLLAIASSFPNDRLHLGASVGFLGIMSVVLATLYLATGFGVELLAGSLLASPALLVSYSVRPGPLGWRLFAFAIALTEGLGLLAAVQALTSSKVLVTGSEFTREFISLNISQGQGLFGLLVATGGPIPLRDFFDPVFVLLAAIAAAGILFTSLRPQTAWGDLLPAAGAMISVPAGSAGAVALNAEFESALAGRSAPESAFEGFPPGLGPLLCGCAAAGLVVAGAFFDPEITLALLVVGTVGGLVATILLMRRPLPSRR